MKGWSASRMPLWSFVEGQDARFTGEEQITVVNRLGAAVYSRTFKEEDRDIADTVWDLILQLQKAAEE